MTAVARIVLDGVELQGSIDKLIDSLDDELESALDRVLNEVAAAILQTRTYKDRSGELARSTQSAGTRGTFSSGTLEGAVAYAATSEDGDEYGIFLEFGTDYIDEGVWMFARRAMEFTVDNTDAFDRAVERALRGAGF